MAYMNKHRPGCCSGCNNGYAQANCTNNTSASSGCSSCGHTHSCGCSHNHGCSSYGCNSCGRSGNGFGTLRSVTGPFSNCSNWWSNDACFPYYTGPCGPCEPCRNCCCPDWPWPPMPPVMPVNGGYVCSGQTEYGTGRNDNCGHSRCADETCYTSHKNCYHTEGSCSDACAARQVKPIVDCSGCKHRCDCED